jgi:hypothetical protein
MNHRTIYLAVTLSFIALFPPRLAGQDTRDTNRTSQTLAQKVKYASHKGAGSAKQRSYYAPVKSSLAPNITETETRVSEAKAAERFMQLKAQVNADLIRLEDGRNTEPVQNAIRASKSDFHFGENLTLSSGNLIDESRPPIMGDAPPVPSKSVAGSNNK